MHRHTLDEAAGALACRRAPACNELGLPRLAAAAGLPAGDIYNAASPTGAPRPPNRPACYTTPRLPYSDKGGFGTRSEG